ncbi:competence protein CoiA family protein [Mesoterricola sediminis]|uniref:competence protein CoiA family protein n=1 Tax=Mesoterricola sediminis TaxID=2927980 RepID=UPI00374234A8
MRGIRGWSVRGADPHALGGMSVRAVNAFSVRMGALRGARLITGPSFWRPRMLTAIRTRDSSQVIHLREDGPSRANQMRREALEGQIVCEDCRQSVTVRAGEERIWHFAHRAGGDCPRAKDSLDVLECRALLYGWLRVRFPDAIQPEKSSPVLRGPWTAGSKGLANRPWPGGWFRLGQAGCEGSHAEGMREARGDPASGVPCEAAREGTGPGRHHPFGAPQVIDEALGQ